MSQEQVAASSGQLTLLEQIANATTRRRFLQWAGVAVGVTLVAGCGDNDGPTGLSGENLGSGDVGVLNYAYALEQLEAAFYTRVVATPFTGISAAERAILTDIRDHEIVHREFLKTALGAGAIGTLTFDFASVNFASRASVLGTAKVFEDLGVGAYNGAGQLLTDVNLLLVAGKIVSVEARHASVIRDLLNPNSADFAGDDVVTVSGGLDQALTPTTVLNAADPFITNAINASSLPTS